MTALPQTFPVTVDGVGEFTFRRRGMRDQFQIEGNVRKTTGGGLELLDNGALAFETLAALTISAPEDWDLLALDPLDEGDWKKMMAVFRALRAAEDRFRGRVSAVPPGGGEAAGGQPAVPVPPTVQSPAE